jgi:seryl-tRNA synthetase
MMSSALSGDIPGLTWNSTGFIGLSGSLLALADAIDERFLELAAAFSAEAQHFGPLLSVEDLRRIDYFSAFPHIVTFPACAARDDAALRQFAQANGANVSGALRIRETAVIQCVLAPAACYGVYIGFQGQDIARLPRVITVRGTCFRSEPTFVPLERQSSFAMREIVHLGNADSVQQFLVKAQELVVAVASEWQLPTSMEVATDSFFDPARSPKYLHAKLFPSKHELVQGGLALASFNNHRNFFGEAYRITNARESIHTACVAFGIERWVAAIVRRHGNEPTHWPFDLDGSTLGRAIA